MANNAKTLDTKLLMTMDGQMFLQRTKNKTLKRGTATSKSEGEMLSADIRFVVFGIAEHVSGIQLSHFLEGKVLCCDLLTKYEGTLPLAYKVTIKSYDFDQKNTEIWPYSVGIRLFKFVNAHKERKEVSGARFQAERQYEKNP